MPWDGNVKRKIARVEATCEGSTIEFVCGHRQASRFPAQALIRLREEVCVECSRPNWDRLAAGPSRTFDEVLDLLRGL